MTRDPRCFWCGTAAMPIELPPGSLHHCYLRRDLLLSKRNLHQLRACSRSRPATRSTPVTKTPSMPLSTRSPLRAPKSSSISLMMVLSTCLHPCAAEPPVAPPSGTATSFADSLLTALEKMKLDRCFLLRPLLPLGPIHGLAARTSVLPAKIVLPTTTRVWCRSALSPAVVTFRTSLRARPRHRASGRSSCH